ncbi:MAG: SAM-dependent methyltransferase [Rhodospirillales bacterium]|jgi:precorrin-2/cobalt-factor-2 C20-methyltransferase
MTGTLWGIGIGPGDPELLTAKAIRLLGALPVLAWPAPLDGDGMARTIAAAYIPPGKIEIPIRLSFRPDRDDTDAAYGRAAETIAAHLTAGRDVGILCEGDPLFFGSFIYVLNRLRDRFPVQVVPGISSPMAAAAVAVSRCRCWKTPSPSSPPPARMRKSWRCWRPPIPSLS